MDIGLIKGKVLQAIEPLRPAAAGASGLGNLSSYGSSRTEAGGELSEYYLVYFLLVDLLGFGYLGQGEKVAWSIPVDLEGRTFSIEHRKLGLGLFASDLPEDETKAREVVRLINRGVKIARPYFDWRAEQAVNDSNVNVVNRSIPLYERFEFFVDQYKAKLTEAETRADERIETKHGSGTIGFALPSFKLRQEAEWLALSAIESFFSWTEHVFIHLAILQGNIVTGNDVKELAKKEWTEKFKAALDINERETKIYYDNLIVIRDQRRNFVAHGSFGKAGEAFRFHSMAGAVPVRLPHHERGGPYSLGGGKGFDDEETIELIQNFISHVWADSLAPARIFLESGLDLVLTMASNGSYGLAMSSVDDMEDFVRYMSYLDDRYSNMDF